MTAAPIFDRNAETALLGALLLAPNLATVTVVEEGVRADHFYTRQHGAIFDALLELTRDGNTVDQQALASHTSDVEGAHEAIAAAYLNAGDPGAFRHHARRVREMHRRETLRSAGELLQAGAANDDKTLIARAEQLLTAPAEAAQRRFTAEQRKELALARLGEQAMNGIPLPWGQLNRMLGGGGMWDGRYVLLGGHTGHGKSAFLDAALEHAATRGKRVGVYITENTQEERTDREVVRHSRLSMDDVEQQTRPADQARAIRDMPNVDLVEAHDMTAAEIARDIGINKWDLAGIDGLHDIYYETRRDLENNGRALLMAAKRSRVPLLVCVHLNDTRTNDYPLPPVNRDIRDSGMLARQADAVLMVWQEEDDEGGTGEGVLRITKNRKGLVGQIPAVFTGAKQTWRELSTLERAA